MTPAFIYICYIYIEKQRKKKQKKKNWPLCRVIKPKHSAKWPAQVSSAASLPSAKVLALGKDLKVYRVPGSSTRQNSHVAGPWAAALLSVRRRHSAKLVLCRVPAVRHSANSPPRVVPRGSYAEGQGSRQSLCRVPEIRHSAKTLLP